MAKRGRPSTPAAQQTVVLRLEQQHVAILDTIIRQRIREELEAGRMVVQQRAAADGKTYALERQINLAVERRRLFGEIVELYQRLRDALTVQVIAPCESDDPERHREAADWIAGLESRLTDEAPVGVQLALARRALRRMDRQDRDPAPIARLLRAARAAGEEMRDDDETS